MQVSIGHEFLRQVDQLIDLLEDGARIWGGGVGAQKKDDVFVVDYTGKYYDEDKEKTFYAARDAVWELLRRANVAVIDVSFEVRTDVKEKDRSV